MSVDHCILFQQPTCGSCSDIIDGSLSVLDCNYSGLADPSFHFRAFTGTRNKQSVAHCGSSILGPIPPSIDGMVPYLVSTSPIKYDDEPLNDVYTIFPNLIMREKYDRYAQSIHFIRNVGCGTNSGIALSRSKDWVAFQSFMFEEFSSGILTLPLTVKYG